MRERCSAHMHRRVSMHSLQMVQKVQSIRFSLSRGPFGAELTGGFRVCGQVRIEFLLELRHETVGVGSGEGGGSTIAAGSACGGIVGRACIVIIFVLLIRTEFA